MERMLDEYLDFARGQIAEDPKRTDIGAILREAAAAAGRGGRSLAVDIEPDLIAPARAGALKRCFANLIENAASFGEAVRVGARRTGNAVEISVEDDGPGIAPEQYEEAFRPFTRLDPSRNQNRKGVGLGLAIARDVARGLGGDVTLSPSALGGLRAVVRIPA
jgi:two-component system osmolarity sensor histidine kinase EnvZ